MSNESMPNMLIDELILCMIVLSDARKHFLGDSDLVLMGEIGGNDYYAHFNAGNKPHGNAADEHITNVMTYIMHFVEVRACTPICMLFSDNPIGFHVLIYTHTCRSLFSIVVRKCS